MSPHQILLIAVVMLNKHHEDEQQNSFSGGDEAVTWPLRGIVSRIAPLSDDVSLVYTSLALFGFESLQLPRCAASNPWSQKDVWTRFAEAYVYVRSGDADIASLCLELSATSLGAASHETAFGTQGSALDNANWYFYTPIDSFQRGDLAKEGAKKWATRRECALWVAALFQEPWARTDAARLAAALAYGDTMGYLRFSLVEDVAASAAAAAAAAAPAPPPASLPAAPSFVRDGESVDTALERLIKDQFWKLAPGGALDAAQLSHDLEVDGMLPAHAPALQRVLGIIADAVVDSNKRIVSWTHKQDDDGAGAGEGAGPAARSKVRSIKEAARGEELRGDGGAGEAHPVVPPKAGRAARAKPSAAEGGRGGAAGVQSAGQAAESGDAAAGPLGGGKDARLAALEARLRPEWSLHSVRDGVQWYWSASDGLSSDARKALYPPPLPPRVGAPPAPAAGVSAVGDPPAAAVSLPDAGLDPAPRRAAQPPPPPSDVVGDALATFSTAPKRAVLRELLAAGIRAPRRGMTSKDAAALGGAYVARLLTPAAHAAGVANASAIAALIAEAKKCRINVDAFYWPGEAQARSMCALWAATQPLAASAPSSTTSEHALAALVAARFISGTGKDALFHGAVTTADDFTHVVRPAWARWWANRVKQ